MTKLDLLPLSIEHVPEIYQVALANEAIANCNMKNTKSMVHAQWHMEPAPRRLAHVC